MHSHWAVMIHLSKLLRLNLGKSLITKLVNSDTIIQFLPGVPNKGHPHVYAYLQWVRETYSDLVNPIALLAHAKTSSLPQVYALPLRDLVILESQETEGGTQLYDRLREQESGVSGKLLQRNQRKYAFSYLQDVQLYMQSGVLFDMRQARTDTVDVTPIDYTDIVYVEYLHYARQVLVNLIYMHIGL